MTPGLKLERGEMALLAGVAIVFALSVAMHSRLYLFFMGPIATLGPMIFLMAALFAAIAPSAYRMNWLYAGALFAPLISIIALIIFPLQTGLSGDWRAFGQYHGLMLVFPFAAAVAVLGLERFAYAFGLAMVGYCGLYIAFTFGVDLGVLGTENRSVVLRDPVRGFRVYPMAIVMIAAIAISIGATLSQKTALGKAFWILAAVISVTALFLAQTRTATLVAVLALLVWSTFGLVRFAKALRWYAALYVPVWLIVALFPEAIGDVMLAADSTTLWLRAQSLPLAANEINANPLLGLGVPADANQHYDYFGVPYFPEDLGGLGVLASTGLLGAASIVLLIFAILASAILVGTRSGSLVAAGLLVGGVAASLNAAFMTTFVSHEASIVSAAALAMGIGAMRLRPVD